MLGIGLRHVYRIGDDVMNLKSAIRLYILFYLIGWVARAVIGNYRKPVWDPRPLAFKVSPQNQDPPPQQVYYVMLPMLPTFFFLPCDT